MQYDKLYNDSFHLYMFTITCYKIITCTYNYHQTLITKCTCYKIITSHYNCNYSTITYDKYKFYRKRYVSEQQNHVMFFSSFFFWQYTKLLVVKLSNAHEYIPNHFKSSNNLRNMPQNISIYNMLHLQTCLIFV